MVVIMGNYVTLNANKLTGKHANVKSTNSQMWLSTRKDRKYTMCHMQYNSNSV